MVRRLGRGALAGIAIAAIPLLAATGAGGSMAAGGLRLVKVGEFASPIYVASAPGAPKLLFVVEQPGKIRIVRDGRVLPRPFLNLSARVKYDRSEQGMYSVAFDPGYAKNRRFYVYYANNAGDIEIDMLKRSRGDATRADAGSRRTVIEIPHPGDVFHNGGQLQFGPDGFLYIGTGDGHEAPGQAPEGNAQDTDVLLGKLLRIDPGAAGGYETPSSNPFEGAAGRPEIYATGLRNPFHFSFDRTGEIYLADVGEAHWEEIDRVVQPDLAGANFGWSLFEGNHPYNGADGTRPPGYQPPLFEYSSADNANCAVLGGVVVHDPSVPALDGRYIYSDFCGEQLRSFDPGNPDGTDATTGLEVKLPSSLATDSHGHVYATSLGGAVYRIAER